MILLNMTPEEKMRQASRLEMDLRSSARSWVEHNQRVLKMRKTFPFRHVIRRKYKGMGEWSIILNFNEKPKFAKGVTFSSNAYQKFYVDRGAKPENIGAGIYMLGGSAGGGGLPNQGVSFHEFTPHFFHRYRQRYLDRNNIKVGGFDELVLAVLDTVRLTMVSDAMYRFGHSDSDNNFLRSQNIPRYEGYDNLAVFTRHGIILGISRPGIDYDCYLTYVDRDDFYEGQRDIYGDVLKLYEAHDRLLEADPYYFIDRDSFIRKEMKDHERLYNFNNR